MDLGEALVGDYAGKALSVCSTPGACHAALCSLLCMRALPMHDKQIFGWIVMGLGKESMLPADCAACCAFTLQEAVNMRAQQFSDNIIRLATTRMQG